METQLRTDQWMIWILLSVIAVALANSQYGPRLMHEVWALAAALFALFAGVLYIRASEGRSRTRAILWTVGFTLVTIADVWGHAFPGRS